MSRLMFGDKELLDLTVKELKVKLGKKDLLKKGRKAELQQRLRAVLENEKMAVSHWRLAVCSCELSRLHRERQRLKRG